MKRQLTRLGALGLTGVAFAAASASPAAAATVSTTFTQCVASGAPILDHGNVQVPFTITVPKNRGTAQLGSVTDVNASVRLNHTFNGDLLLQLVSPGGVLVNLAAGRGGSSDNYGTGLNSCGGVPVFFDDAFLTSISTQAGPPPADGAPITGFFKPDGFLSAFNGGPAAGTWRFVVSDNANGDTGALGAATLTVNYTYLQSKKKKKKKKKK